MNIANCVLILLSLCLVKKTVKAEGKCSLPTFQQDVDYNMLPGNWYVILEPNDPYSRMTNCYSIHDMKEVGNNVYMVYDNIYYEEQSKQLKHWYTPVKNTVKESFALELDKKFVSFGLEVNEDLSKEKNLDKKNTKDTAKEINEFYSEEYVMITDYENYLFELRCTNGSPHIWVHSRNPSPTVQDLLRIFNKLVQLGNGWSSVPLILSRCREISEYVELKAFD